MLEALAPWTRWIVLAHVLFAILFLAAHAPSVVAMVLLRRERDPGAVRSLLSMSRVSTLVSIQGLYGAILTGVLLATMERAWSQPWVWGAVVLLVALSVAMGPLGTRVLNEARIAAGLPWTDGVRKRAAGPADGPALEIALAKIARRMPWTMALGILGALALVALMVLKPGLP
jgi:hypothetical protein